MVDDILLNKAKSIERCLQRVTEEYLGHEDELESNYTKQDSIILNLQRACETAIDAAMHLVRVHRLGLPEETRQAFTLLADAGILSLELAERLEKMVGFRNLAVHEYQTLDLNIVRAIVTTRLGDFRLFVKVMLHGAMESNRD